MRTPSRHSQFESPTTCLRLLFSMGLALCLLATAARPLPRGEIQTWAEKVYYRFGPFGETRTIDGGLFHADGYLLPINTGAWSFWLESSSEGDELRASGKRIPTRLGRLSIEAGDFPLRMEGDDPLRREFQQSTWVRGGSVTLGEEDASLELRGGRLTERRGFLTGGREATESSIYGLTLARSKGRGRMEIQWDRRDSGGGDDTGRQVLRAYAAHRSPRGWSWMGAARLSNPDGRGGFGTSLVAGTEFRQEALSIGGHLRRVSPEFRGLGILTDPHVNEWGGRLQVHARPRRGVLAGGTMDWGRDLSPRGGRSPEERLVLRWSLATTLVGPLYMRGNLNYRDRSTVDPESLLVDQSTFSGRGELGWRSSSVQAHVAYERGIHRDPTLENGDWHEDSFAARCTGRLRRGLQTELSGGIKERRLPNGIWTSREKKLELRLSWERKSLQRIWVIAGREMQQANTRQFERDQWLLGAAWAQPLPGRFLLSIETRGFLSAGGKQPESARLNIMLRRDFNFGGESPTSLESLPEYGMIHGTVFDDVNGNGHRDEGEPGIPGQVMSLGSGAQTETSDDGTFVFRRVATGLQLMHLDVSHLPTRYLAPEESRFRFSLRPGQRHRLQIPVRRAASVAGRVVALDGDGATQGVAGVLVRVRGTHRDVFTDADGRFRIEGLDAGPIVVEVVEWTLADDLHPTGGLSQGVTLWPGQTAATSNFLFEKKAPSVLQHFRR